MEMVEANGELPFTVVRRYRVRAKKGPNTRALSQSDVEALELSHRSYGHLNFRELTDISHEEAAYRKADGGDMRYEDFLEESPDREERARDIAEISAFIPLTYGKGLLI
jgi:hypothetical protein